MNCDVAVVGAGPAGLTAAAFLARRGVRVAVIDESFRPGGRLLGQIHGADQRSTVVWDGPRVATELETEVRNAGGAILVGHTVWNIDSGWTLHLSPGPDSAVRARAVIVATGATERAVPIPGWTLPGVMTIGAAQVLTNVHHIAPGDRVLVVGIDPLALAVTGAMAAAGVRVVGVYLPPPGALAGDRALPRGAIAGLAHASRLAPTIALRVAGRLVAGRLGPLAAHLAGSVPISAWGVRLGLRTACTRIVGDDTVTGAIVRSVDAGGRLTGNDRLIEADAICISGGLAPLSDLARLAGCEAIDVPELGGLVPLHGPVLETRQPGLFVAGNLVGIEAAPVAAAQGRLAAAAALGFVAGTGAHGPDTDEAIRMLAQARRSAQFSFLPDAAEGHGYVQAVWAGGRPIRAAASRSDPLPEADLTICRCEDVPLGRITWALDDGATAIAGVKKRTRACMGMCQGRVCEDVIRRLPATNRAEALMRHRPRPPLRPTSLSDIARGGERSNSSSTY